MTFIYLFTVNCTRHSRKTRATASGAPNGVNFAGPVYEQPIESSMRSESLSRPARANPDLPPKATIVNVQTTHYSTIADSRSRAAPHPSVPSAACLSPLPTDQPSHTNSFTVNTFTLRKAPAPSPQALAPGALSSGAATLFPYSTVDFGDTSAERVHHQPVNYAQVS